MRSRLFILLASTFILLTLTYAALSNPVRAQSPNPTPTPGVIIIPTSYGDYPHVSGVVLLPNFSGGPIHPSHVNIVNAAAYANLRANPNDNSNKAQNEMCIAIDPNNPNNIVIGANDARVPNSVMQSGYFATTDGGATWADGILPFPSGANPRGDPALVFDNGNRVYYASLGLNSQNFSNCDSLSGLYVARSTVGGGSWETATEIAANSNFVFHDKPSIAADHSGGVYSGSIYVAWNADTFSACNHFAPPFPIVVKYTRDSGMTWSGPVTATLPENSCSDGASAAVGADGTVYVAFENNSDLVGCAGTNRIMVAKSADGGQTFSTNYLITDTNPVGGFYANASYTFRANSFPNLAADPSDANRLFVVWANGYACTSGTCADILYSHSTDGGMNWSAPLRLNDDANDGRDHFFPAIAIAPNGTVYISWYDRRSAVKPANPYLYNVFAAYSTDHGATWAPNVRVSDVSSDPASYNFSSAPYSPYYFIGDYSGLAVADNRNAYPAWTDTRDSGDQNPYTARFSLLGQKDLRFPVLFLDVNP